MNRRVLTMSLDSQNAVDLSAILEGWQVQHVAGRSAMESVLVREGHQVALLVVGAEVPAEVCAGVFNWVKQYTPHVQCVLAARESQMKKLIEVKNQVTSMSVLLCPWQQEAVVELAEKLSSRSAQSFAEERFLGLRLAPFVTNVGQGRVIALFQLLGDGTTSDGASERLSSYLEVAVAFREHCSASAQLEREFELHAVAESTRMQEVFEHLKEWHAAFEQGSRVPSLPSVFSVQDGVLLIRDIEGQFAPVNGPVGATPTAEQCCLLALLSWPRSRSVLSKRHDGVWIIENAFTTTTNPGRLSELLI